MFEPIVDGYQPARPPARSRWWQTRTGRNALTAGAVVVVALLAVGGFFGARAFTKSGSTTALPSSVTVAPTTVAPTTSKPPAQNAPPSGASLAEVFAWIQEAKTAEVAKFHTATTSEGKVNDLGTAVAFRSPSQKIQCMTASATAESGGLACLVAFDDPPARPSSSPSGNWKGGWVDFPGATAGIGRLAGDPGQFLLGNGPTFDYDTRLSFGDYDCRMDQTGLWCGNRGAGSALRLSSEGAEAFGCLKKTTSGQYGINYTCTAATTTSVRPSTSGSATATPRPSAGGSTTTRTSANPAF
ncbi:hypothetical protein [Nocardia inohanensis]|uniref:hypothetical protein n=1 Tax=Nocardia inohanensis TaxID=209246 RepID=UPI0012FAC24C|nr:hypothetical protein [Nocardia inohanensis]